MDVEHYLHVVNEYYSCCDEETDSNYFDVMTMYLIDCRRKLEMKKWIFFCSSIHSTSIRLKTTKKTFFFSLSVILLYEDWYQITFFLTWFFPHRHKYNRRRMKLVPVHCSTFLVEISKRLLQYSFIDKIIIALALFSLSLLHTHFRPRLFPCCCCSVYLAHSFKSNNQSERKEISRRKNHWRFFWQNTDQISIVEEDYTFIIDDFVLHCLCLLFFSFLKIIHKKNTKCICSDKYYIYMIGKLNP